QRGHADIEERQLVARRHQLDRDAHVRDEPDHQERSERHADGDGSRDAEAGEELTAECAFVGHEVVFWGPRSSGPAQNTPDLSLPVCQRAYSVARISRITETLI